MEQLPQNFNKEKAEKGFEKQIDNLLEQEKEFLNWKDKVKFTSLSFFESKIGFSDFLENDDSLVYDYERILSEKNIFFEDERFVEELGKLKEEILDFYNKHDLLETYKKYFSFRINEIPENQNNKIEHHYFGAIELDNKNYIHFNKQGNERQHFNLEESFALLCDYLAEQDIVPSEIHAESWLMDTSIRERIGFEKISYVEFNREDGNLGLGLWGQFVDEQGNLKEKELKYLFENNKPRYKLTTAKISFENLIKRYGQKYIGQTFETLDQEDYIKEKEKIEKETKEIGKYLREDLKEKGFEDFYNFVEYKNIWAEFIHTAEGKRLLEIIKFFSEEMNNRACSFKDLRNYCKAEIAEVQKIKTENFDKEVEKFLEQFKKPNKIIMIN